MTGPMTIQSLPRSNTRRIIVYKATWVGMPQTRNLKCIRPEISTKRKEPSCSSSKCNRSLSFPIDCSTSATRCLGHFVSRHNRIMPCSGSVAFPKLRSASPLPSSVLPSPSPQMWRATRKSVVPVPRISRKPSVALTSGKNRSRRTRHLSLGIFQPQTTCATVKLQLRHRVQLLQDTVIRLTKAPEAEHVAAFRKA